MGRGVKALLYSLPLLSISGHVAKRVLLRIAEVLEGKEYSENVADTSIPLAEDREEDEDTKQWRLSQHAIFIQVWARQG